MKKLCIICVALVVSMGAVHAQEFGKGTKTIKLGAGLNHWGLPTGLAEFEIGILDNMGIDGLNLGIGGVAGFNFRHHGDWNETNFGIAAQSFAHYMPVDRLDCYVGVMIGTRIYTNKYSKNDNLFNNNNGVKPLVSPIIGARYQFTSSFSAYGNFAIDGNMYFTCAGVAFEF